MPIFGLTLEGDDPKRWAENLRYLPRQFREAGMARTWEAVGDTMFTRSQEKVHVDTSNLKSTGQVRLVTPNEGVFVIEIEYGGPGRGNPARNVVYAEYEHKRGSAPSKPVPAKSYTKVNAGRHDWLQWAYEETYQDFRKAFGLMLDQLAGVVVKGK